MGRFNTTNVIEHLQNDHAKKCDKFVQALGAKEKCQCLKQTLLEGMKKCEKLDSDTNNESKVVKKSALLFFIIMIKRLKRGVSMHD